MSSSFRHTLATRLTAAALVAAAIFALSSTPAFADPIADAQAQAAKVQAQVDALNVKAEQASEEFNRASDRYSTLSQQAADSERALKKVSAQKDKLQNELDSRATSLYRQGPLGFLNVLLGARSMSDFDAAYQMMTNIGRRDAQTVDKLKDAKVVATKTHDRLDAQQRQAAIEKHAMASNAALVRSELGKRRDVLASANQQVKTLIAAKKAAEAAAARAEAARLAALSGGGGSGRNIDWGPAPPASEIGKRAVWVAEKKIGCPYVWAAAGPNEFDCSGLCMWAYEQVGVSLPHYSREQINVGRRVNKSDLAPGDLVFFGDPIHHVGMYVGGGQFIEAPYTGANVRISSLDNRGDFAGASRPYAK